MALWPNPENISNVSSAVTWINSVTKDQFGFIMLIIIFFISFLGLKIYATDKALAASSFLCLVLAILMYGATWIGFNVLLLFVILTGVSLVYTTLESE